MLDICQWGLSLLVGLFISGDCPFRVGYLSVGLYSSHPIFVECVLGAEGSLDLSPLRSCTFLQI